MELISCEELSVGYDGNVVAGGINFNVNAGDYLCIIGENGAGKSTLMKTLLGLQHPLSGNLSFQNGLLQREIGYLPQQTEVQKDFPASVREVVQSGCLTRSGFWPFWRSNEINRCAQTMKMLDIFSFRKRSYRELSGGQQQRVLLARALCATGKLLVLDEPVAGLDPIVTAELYTIIRRLNQEGITVIMVTHDMNAALEYASHILHVSRKNVFYGTKNDYMQTTIGQAFIGLSKAVEGGIAQ